MTSIERTAYPRFGRLVSARELGGLSPSADEVAWARDLARSEGGPTAPGSTPTKPADPTALRRRRPTDRRYPQRPPLNGLRPGRRPSRRLTPKMQAATGKSANGGCSGFPAHPRGP